MADGDPGPSHSRQRTARRAGAREQDILSLRHNIPDPASEVVMTHEIHTYFRKMINQYEFDHRVGRGQHGDVFLARDTSSGGIEVAIKAVKRKNPKVDKLSMLRKRNLPSSPHLPLTDQLGSTEHKIRKEIAIMKKCCHPHVVRLLEVIDDNLNERIFMVMEYLGGGELKWRTSTHEPVLRVDQTRRICRDVILGLEYLHHQGIIHRDIKPANLLWTSDRRTVKITDFGVSHFSYAQRLAAAGAGIVPSGDTDPILMDDSDLSKTAGTPMFLAPEIVSDTADIAAASSSSSTLHLAQRRKPPITKAIDVWAFGVTLYGLLFGNLPFHADTTWEIYQVIRRNDWSVEPEMGVDSLPTGGRYQRPQRRGEETDGYLVVKLLEGLLEKDARKRITLDEVKRHPWIIRDIENPQAWLHETQLDRDTPLVPTADETSSAMSSVRFRYSSPNSRKKGRSRVVENIQSGLRNVWRNVKPQRSFWGSSSNRDAEEEEENKFGVQSAPNMRISRHRTSASAGRQYHGSREEQRSRDPYEKGEKKRVKQRSTQRVDGARNKSTTDVSRQQREPDVWALWNDGSASTAMASSIQGSAPKPRRGSFPSRLPGMTLEVPAKPSRVSSPQPSPGAFSLASTPSGEGSGTQSPDERPRSRLSLSWIRAPWKGKSTSQDPNASSVSVGRRASIGKRGRMSRRSEDAFNVVAPSRQSTASGPLTLAMRAASWGEVGDYARPSEDMTSLYSGERGDDALDDATLFLGAGGVAASPISSGLLSTVSSNNSYEELPAALVAPRALSAAHAILQRNDGGEAASAADPATQDAAALARQRGPRTTSPLAQVSYNEGELSIDRVRSYGSDEFDDASSIFGPDGSHSSGVSCEDDVELQPSTSQMYQDEDEESEDEEHVRLEVRTRRPSASAADRSPPPNPERAHRGRAMICT